MSDEQGADSIALLETLTEARALIEELTRLAEDLKVRHEQLSELLAPSETALRARTEYLDRVLREQLKGVDQRSAELSRQVSKDSSDVRQLMESVKQHGESQAQLIAAAVQKSRVGLSGWSIVSMLLIGTAGFLSGIAASGRWAVRSAPPETIVAEPSSPSAKPAPAARRPARSRPSPGEPVTFPSGS